MLGSFNNNIDKRTCIISFIVLSLVTVSITYSGLFSLINISGVFKQ